VLRNARSESDIDSAFESLAQQRVNAVIIGTDLLFTSRRDQLVVLAARHAASDLLSARVCRRWGVECQAFWLDVLQIAPTRTQFCDVGALLLRKLQ
jgi:hypothetical protein